MYSVLNTLFVPTSTRSMSPWAKNIDLLTAQVEYNDVEPAATMCIDLEQELLQHQNAVNDATLDLRERPEKTDWILHQSKHAVPPADAAAVGLAQMQAVQMELDAPPAMPAAPLPQEPLPKAPPTPPPGYEQTRHQKPCYSIPRKHTDKLFEFDGGVRQYRLCKERMIDHMSERWPAWREIVAACETHKAPIGWSIVQQMNVLGFNGTELALDLWCVLSRFLGMDLYSRRKHMSINIDGNGFELWRRLFLENEGASELVALAGKTKPMSFPQCTNKKHLGQPVDDWIDMMQNIALASRLTMHERCLWALSLATSKNNPAIHGLEIFALATANRMGPSPTSMDPSRDACIACGQHVPRSCYQTTTRSCTWSCTATSTTTTTRRQPTSSTCNSCSNDRHATWPTWRAAKGTQWPWD